MELVVSMRTLILTTNSTLKTPNRIELVSTSETTDTASKCFRQYISISQHHKVSGWWCETVTKTTTLGGNSWKLTPRAQTRLNWKLKPSCQNSLNVLRLWSRSIQAVTSLCMVPPAPGWRIAWSKPIKLPNPGHHAIRLYVNVFFTQTYNPRPTKIGQHPYFRNSQADQWTFVVSPCRMRLG